jgi:phosphatidylserine/phosphatidylglycerophosphate/cardiolipin synthase-like enzyme
MPTIQCLNRGWENAFSNLLRSAKKSVLICAPFVTRDGAEAVVEHLSEAVREQGSCRIVTNLSPLNVLQHVTDPSALKFLVENVPSFTVWHLPKLHAKVYIADARIAIVTSANLTGGGLTHNYEYGVHIRNAIVVRQIRNDITAYSELGACLTVAELNRYVVVSEQVRAAFERQQRSISRTARNEFERLFYEAENELIALRVSGASRTRVFERTIEYLLGRYGAISTPEIHARIASIHPDLCDETVDRVINGRHFGKQWKHAVRTAQSHLKQAGSIQLVAGKWRRLHAAA